jgi:hypothetical protein
LEVFYTSLFTQERTAMRIKPPTLGEKIAASMPGVFVGDSDHGDAVPPTDVLLQMIKLLREDVVHFAAELDTAQGLNRRILSEINCRIEHGADSNGHLEGVYGLFRDDKTEADANNTRFRTTDGE